MTLRDRIQDWLGISEMLARQTTDRQLIMDQSERLGRVQTQLNTIVPGLGRVIAKLDAKYTESEFSAERKAESDRIGEEALRRLAAEAKAREPYND